MSALLTKIQKHIAVPLRGRGDVSGGTLPTEALRAAQLVAFALSFFVLNLCVNLMWFHRHLPVWSLLLPSFEILGLTVILALVQGRGLGVSFPARLGLTVLLAWLVVFRLIDVGVQRFMHLEIDMAQVLRLAPEFVRLGFSTLPLWQFILACVLVLGALSGLGFVISTALRANLAALTHPQLRRGLYWLAAGLGCIAALSTVVPMSAQPYRQYGVFTPTYLPELLKMGRRLWGKDERVAHARLRVDRQRARLSRMPASFGRLSGRAVHLVFIESYGMSVFTRDDYRAELESDFVRFAGALARAGFQIRSGQLRSPTFAGGSWLAHGTMSTGLKLDDHVDHELVLQANPVTLSGLLGAAGYRTVGVWPGTKRPLEPYQRRGFQETIAGFEMEYAGPSYAWAPMPDQYVLDFARRHLASHSGPRFVEYGLVSSHFPFSPHADYVQNWEMLGDGHLYKSQKPVDYGVSWHDSSQMPAAYLGCIRYDLQVLTEFIVQFGERDGLFILLGDHQPMTEVAGENATHDVPVHVVSREADLLARFEARGYVPGWAPDLDAPVPPMEAFMPAFIADFGPER